MTASTRRFPSKILNVEDDANDAELVSERIRREWPSCSVLQVATLPALQAALTVDTFDLILTDYDLRSFTGSDVLIIARAFAPATPVIFLTGAIGEEKAFDLMREGASDYVFKDRMERLTMVIPRALQERDEHRRRLKAEAELRESENRFRSMFLCMAEGVILFDAEGRIVSINPSAQRILGLETTEELLGSMPAWRAVRENLSPLGSEELPWSVARRTGKPQPDTMIGLYQPTGALVWVIANAQPFQSSDEGARSLVVTMHEITEKKSLEAQFLRIQRFESLGLLSAGIAHDLNNILAPILMGVPLLRSRSTRREDERVLDTMEKSANRGADLVRQIMSFTRGLSGSSSLVQLRHIARDLIALLEATLPKTVRIEYDIPTSTWPVRGNPSQFHQMLLNLCVNARDAMANGGVLSIKMKNAHLPTAEATERYGITPGAYVHITVSDTGPGIPAHLLPRIWEPFFTTKGPDKGTGLGLSTVRGVVQSHHGAIEVETAPNKGTTFHLLLPADERSVTQSDLTTPQTIGATRGNAEMILLVDDETEIRDMATALLVEKGYRVLTAKDGLDAFSQLLRHGSDTKLLITDLGMPELDGTALCKMARRQFPNIQIITMSGGATGATDPSYKTPSDAFIEKPFSPEVLLNTVHELLSLKRA